MNNLKIFTFSFFVIFFSTVAYGEDYYHSKERVYCSGYDVELNFREFFRDIRSRALTIMSMIDKNKNKSKDQNLSILLEAELNILKSEIGNRIESCKNKINQTKQNLYANNTNQNAIKTYLRDIEREEKRLSDLEGARLLAKQWKRDYCN